MRPIFHLNPWFGPLVMTHETHKSKKHCGFPIFPVIANDGAITKTGKACLEGSLRDGTSNEISTRFQCGIQEGYQKGLPSRGLGQLGRTGVSELTYTACSKLGGIISRFPRDPLPQFMCHYRRIPYERSTLRHRRAVRRGCQELLEFC